MKVPFHRLIANACLVIASLLSAEANQSEEEDPGFVVYRERCMACHLQTGLGIQEMNAPSIAGLPRWYVSDQLRKFRRDQRGYHQEDPSGHLMKMNAAALDERSIAFVGRFIENLPINSDRNTAATQPTEAAGKLYTEHCGRCHGDDAEGNRSLRIPPLTRQQDWYLLRQMANFSEGKRIHHNEQEPELDEQSLTLIIAWIAELSLSAR